MIFRGDDSPITDIRDSGICVGLDEFGRCGETGELLADIFADIADWVWWCGEKHRTVILRYLCVLVINI